MKLLQFTAEGMTSRQYTMPYCDLPELNPNDSLHAVIEQQFSGFTTKKVTVLYARMKDYNRVLTACSGEGLISRFQDLHSAVQAAVTRERGFLHSCIAGRFAIDLSLPQGPGLW